MLVTLTGLPFKLISMQNLMCEFAHRVPTYPGDYLGLPGKSKILEC